MALLDFNRRVQECNQESVDYFFQACIASDHAG